MAVGRLDPAVRPPRGMKSGVCQIDRNSSFWHDLRPVVPPRRPSLRACFAPCGCNRNRCSRNGCLPDKFPCTVDSCGIFLWHYISTEAISDPLLPKNTQAISDRRLPKKGESDASFAERHYRPEPPVSPTGAGATTMRLADRSVGLRGPGAAQRINGPGDRLS